MRNRIHPTTTHSRYHIPKHDSQSVQKLGKAGIYCPFLKAPYYNGAGETESSTLQSFDNGTQKT